MNKPGPLSECRPAKPRVQLNLWLILLPCLASTAGWGKENQTASPLAEQPGRLLQAGGVALSANPPTEELYRVRIFEEQLVPIAGVPTAAENAALAAALIGYAQRSGPDDFSSMAAFLESHPQSPWRAALQTCLGLEYYKTAHYSLALAAWEEAWSLAQKATTVEGRFLADRAVCELAGLYSRLGRIHELEALLNSVKGHVFLGGASERINLAGEALWMMQNQPGVSFRCGPLALQSIKRSLGPQGSEDIAIFNSASTQQGFSLAQVAELSRKVGLNYQIAFRSGTPVENAPTLSRTDAPTFVVPSVVHWKVGHYAALVRQVGDRYLLEDPTFGNSVWATRQALESETSGYFLIPPGSLPPGWRSVDEKEGASVWGRGTTSGNDPDPYTCRDTQTEGCGPFASCAGMAVSTIHLMLANLQVKDTPVGYTPPVGPPVKFTLRYNQRDYLQPPSLISAVLGPKWTHDWMGGISDNPGNPLADVKYLAEGGGARTFTGFDTNTQTFAQQQYDQTQLKRIGTNTYEMLFHDGSKKVFGLRQGSAVLLTQVVDPAGNAVTLTWEDAELGLKRLAAITDALGQVTTISYEHPTASLLITKVTDPFGRFATFDYGTFLWDHDNNTNTAPVPIFILSKITDVLGLQSQFSYPLQGDIMQQMITPYGTTGFSLGQGPGTTRVAERLFPDGSRDRVEYNQGVNIPGYDPVTSVPSGMFTYNGGMVPRNTFYWSRTACASSYGDYSKAAIFHWLHAENMTITSGILESTKKPLEGRVWYDYPGQSAISPYRVGTNNRPAHIGRVLDDGQTQLHSYEYNPFGRVTKSVDPIGRTFSYVYATNGIDLLEMRQTRLGNELLFRATYNSQHLPLTIIDAAGQTNTFTYNARGQVLTRTNPRGETTAYSYDTNGYLVAVDGPLPGTADLVTTTYDAFGRIRTITDVSGYTLTYDYDVMDRITKITHPDSTFEQFTYERLNQAAVRDRAGRQTFFEHDNMRQMTKKTDPLGRVTLFDWCRCGSIKSITDPMGRTTSWLTDVQSRTVAKLYSDGSQVSYLYETASSRLRQRVDEKQQVTQFTWNRDDTLKSTTYLNNTIATPGISFTYSPDYPRVISMMDGTGTTLYSYNPINAVPALGAGRLASVDGPLPNDTITCGYDDLGRLVHRAINGIVFDASYDTAGRVIGETNALGAFAYGYDASSERLVSILFPNGQAAEFGYTSNLQDRTLHRITYMAGAAPLSEFIYGHEVPAHRIQTWSQQAGAQAASLHTFGYDTVNQLLSATVTNAGILINTFGYSYDAAGNRLIEQVGTSNLIATYNALNQLNTSTALASLRSNEWDAVNRLVAVNLGNQRTEFSYDGLSRMVAIRQLVNGSEISHRRFVWCGGRICEERDAAGAVTKRFFPQGMKLESGPNAGNYFYTRDHLGSIRELTDASGTLRARYSYDPWGRSTRVAGDMEADFGFAGMFWATEANLSLTHFRAYDPELGRWLSRDPLGRAEMKQGPNLYAYVGNTPVNLIDPEGLMDSAKAALLQLCARNPTMCRELLRELGTGAEAAAGGGGSTVAAGAGGVAGGVTGAVAAGAPAAAVVCETAGPAAETVLPEGETYLPGVLGGRLQAVIERIPEARTKYGNFVSTITDDFPDTDRFALWNGYAIPQLPSLLAEMDIALEETALGYVGRYGGTLPDAWELLLRLAGLSSRTYYFLW